MTIARVSKRIRTLVPLAVGVALTAMMSACDPYPVPDDAQSVDLDYTLAADGSAVVDVFLPDREPSTAALLPRVQSLAPSLLPGAGPSRVRVNTNDGGSPFFTVEFASAFQPSSSPTASVDLKPAAAQVLALGYRRVSLTIATPDLDQTGSWDVSASSGSGAGYWSWYDVTDAAQAPTGHVVFHPNALRAQFGAFFATLSLLLTLTWLALVVAGWATARSARRHGVAVAVAVADRGARPARRLLILSLVYAAVGTAILALVLDTYPAGDTLAITGLIGAGGQVAVSIIAVLSIAIAAVNSIAYTVYWAATTPPTWTFEAAPGWPSPPAGWTPPPGWAPDPSWPPAPAGWPRMVRKRSVMRRLLGRDARTRPLRRR